MSVAEQNITGIDPDRLYRLDQIPALTGWGSEATKKAREAGLEVLFLHRRGFVRGRSLIDTISKRATNSYHG